MKSTEWKTASAKGGRTRNEDTVRAGRVEAPGEGDGHLVAVVCDGIGGQPHGETAGRTAATAFAAAYADALTPLPQGARMRRAVRAANKTVGQAQAENPALAGMGTTLTAAAVTTDGLDWIGVGDSPLYHVDGREHEIVQLNERHNPPAAPNRLTSAITGDQIAAVSRAAKPRWLREGDTVIVATDGLDTLGAADIRDLVAEENGNLAESLVARALAANRPSQDNVTVAAVRIDAGLASSRRPMIEAVRCDGEAYVYIDGEPLEWSRSLVLRNHSPTGVEWGYAGSGPAQLALALLIAVTGDEQGSLRRYQQFKVDLIAGAPQDGWQLPVATVQAWVEANHGHGVA